MKTKLISIFLCSILFIGCTNAKIENVGVDRQIYESPYEMVEEDVIRFKDLQEELEKNEIELFGPTYYADDRNQDGNEEYFFQTDSMRINIYNRKSLKEDGNQVVKGIEVHAYSGHELSTHPFIKSLAYVMEDEKIIPWLRKQEEKVKQHAESEEDEGNDYILDIMVTGRNYALFTGSQEETRKELEFYWGIEEEMTKELEGIAAELENQGLLTIDHANGFGGDQVNMMSPQYYLVQNHHYFYRNKEQIKADIDKAVSYKVMYDPNVRYNYSAQLYGLMPEDLGYTVKVEDMVGIDTISRAMDMSWEDFNSLTNTINEELTKARELLNPHLQQEYNIEGKIGEYHYEIYVPSGIEIYRFTVLIEKD